MNTNPETGYLLIADLTGYTAYLSRGELEHAPVIAGDLIETIVGRLEPPFRLAKLEGDAAFLFVEDGRADGPLLLDAIEAAYLGFRRRLRSIETATDCACQACALAPRLDLKLFLHHGAFVRSPIAGHDELAGSSVILIHRLLKGPTAEAAHDGTGAARGFALVTADAMAALGVSRASLDAVEAREIVDPFGEVTLQRIDLEARWLAEQGRRRIEIGSEDATIEIRVDVAMPPAEVWANLTSPTLRSSWEGAIITLDDPDGPRGVGARSRCVTGRLATIEEIVDWQPYDHIGYRLAVPGLGPVEATYDIEAGTASTAVQLRWATPPGTAVDPAAIDRSRMERRAALDRLVARARRATAPDTTEVLL